MELFKKSENDAAFLKGSISGFPGSGKTLTATLIAIGLHRYLKSDKPVCFLDTENGSSYVKPYFDKTGVPLMVARTRAFIDLLNAVDEAEKNGLILLIDSASHFWTELQQAYKAKKKKDRLTLQDWGALKPEWAKFTEKFLTSKVHIIFTGRSGWEFEDVEDEDGAKQLTKIGTKMKVETDLAYEPALSLEMERVKKSKSKIGSDVILRCWVWKDKFNLINGTHSDFKLMRGDQLDITENNPAFKLILPHVNALNLGGQHKALEVGHDSQAIFNTDRSVAEYMKQKDIAIEEIENEITLKYPGRDVSSQQAKLNILKDLFDTTSWTAIKAMKLDILLGAQNKLKQEIKNA